jgi:cyclase
MQTLFLVLALTWPATAQDFATVKITRTPLTKSIHMLQGSGGNMGLSVGSDGVFLIDDQYAPLNGKILAAIAQVAPGPVKLLLNTHWHFDHTGGNEPMGKSGTVIVAHDNVRKRMAVDNFIKAFNKKVPAAAPAALPVVTFDQSVTLHLNGEDIRVTHVPHAHTDGDAIVHFPTSNVIHTGDIFFNGFYPFIDVDSGGSLAGLMAAVEKILALSNSKTQIIPGHGPLANRKDLQRYLRMLKGINKEMARQLKNGQTAATIAAAKPTQKYDKKWGGGFLKPEKFAEIAFAAHQANARFFP